MSVAPHAGAGGLTNAKLELANAGTGDVAAGKSFYAGDKILKKGTLVLTGDAGDGDVLNGKTYYNNDLKSQRKGSMPNRGSWGTTISPGGSVTVPPGYHNGNGSISAKSIKTAYVYLSDHNATYPTIGNTSGGRISYTIPRGTLIGIVNVKNHTPDCSINNWDWSFQPIRISGNTLYTDFAASGSMLLEVIYAYYE